MPYAGVLAVVPAGAEAELDPATAHGVDLRHRDRERAGERNVTGETRVPSRRRRVAGEAGEGDPGVGGAGEAASPKKLM